MQQDSSAAGTAVQLTTLRGRVCSILKKAKPPAPNMTRRERTAVRNLRERQDLVILTADKGNATVVMDQTDYKKKIEDLLEDPVYRKISKDPTSATERKITKELKDLEQKKLISKDQMNRLSLLQADPPNSMVYRRSTSLKCHFDPSYHALGPPPTS